MMKRRKFLISSALAFIGFLFVPNSVDAMSLENEGIVIPLPEAEEHVRHGNFNLTEASNVQLPNGVKNVRFQRFFKNGVNDSPDDLCLVTFEYDNEEVVIQFKFSELCEKGYLNCEEKSKNKGVHIFTLI